MIILRQFVFLTMSHVATLLQLLMIVVRIIAKIRVQKRKKTYYFQKHFL